MSTDSDTPKVGSILIILIIIVAITVFGFLSVYKKDQKQNAQNKARELAKTHLLVTHIEKTNATLSVTVEPVNTQGALVGEKITLTFGANHKDFYMISTTAEIGDKMIGQYSEQPLDEESSDPAQYLHVVSILKYAKFIHSSYVGMGTTIPVPCFFLPNLLLFPGFPMEPHHRVG
jgi:hypothetical protein